MWSVLGKPLTHIVVDRPLGWEEWGSKGSGLPETLFDPFSAGEANNLRMGHPCVF